MKKKTRKNNMTLEQCLKDEHWYSCPIPLATFIIFFLLFLYSCYIMAQCGSLIRSAEDIGTDAFTAKYGKTLKDVATIYVMNLVVCVLCIIVLTFFLYKSLPVKLQSALFNQYVGASIVLVVFIITSATLAFFNSIGSEGKSKTAIWTTSVFLVLTLVALSLYAYKIYEFFKLRKK
jgi:magnesium-transporting ATPase (P-type)